MLGVACKHIIVDKKIAIKPKILPPGASTVASNLFVQFHHEQSHAHLCIITLFRYHLGITLIALLCYHLGISLQIGDHTAIHNPFRDICLQHESQSRRARFGGNNLSPSHTPEDDAIADLPTTTVEGQQNHNSLDEGIDTTIAS
jgi:hypothetical protein